nr:uncharacterized mitochondrial protein AtMg00660-like [Ipomoea batatas]
MRPFGEANSISGHQTLQLMRRPYGVKVSVYVVTLPAFQRCLEDGPDAAERRPRSGFPTGRGTGGGHLKAHHDLQATPARPAVPEVEHLYVDALHSQQHQEVILTPLPRELKENLQIASEDHDFVEITSSPNNLTHFVSLKSPLSSAGTPVAIESANRPSP